MKSPVLAPLYVAIYPDLAELFRSHGYALSIYGSLAKDFDLIAIPWADRVSDVKAVLNDLEQAFGMKSVRSKIKNHGRLCHTIIMGHGSCYMDLSFVNCMSLKEEIYL